MGAEAFGNPDGDDNPKITRRATSKSKSNRDISRSHRLHVDFVLIIYKTVVDFKPMTTLHVAFLVCGAPTDTQQKKDHFVPIMVYKTTQQVQKQQYRNA